jgi:membrane protein
MEIADRASTAAAALARTPPLRFLLAVRDLSRREDLPYLAAALAYYALVSIVPVIVLVVAIASIFAAEDVLTLLLNLFGRSLSPTGKTVVESTVVAAQGRGGVTIAGLAVLLWSAMRLFRALDLAFDRVYGTRTETTLLGTIRDMAAVVAGIAIAIGLVAGTVLIVTVVDPTVGLKLLGTLGLPIALFVVFLPFYVGFPDREIGLRAAAPGAAVAALGWSGLGVLFQFYASIAGDRAIYGLLGGVLLFVTWLYVANLLVLLGAATNAVAAGTRTA